MSRQVVIGAVAVIVAVAAGIAIGAVVFGDDEAASRRSPATTTTGTARRTTGGSTTTSSPGATVVDHDVTDRRRAMPASSADAIERADGLTYHVVFEGSTPAPSRRDGGASSRSRCGSGRRWLAVTRRSPAPTGQLESIELRLEDELLGCFRLQPTQPFQCRPNPSPEAEPSDSVFGEVDPTAGPVTAATPRWPGWRPGASS